MAFIKTKHQVIRESLGSVNESVFKMGDVYKVKTVIDIPKSVINAFISKAKKEHGIDPKENWADVDLAELITNYVIATYINIESLPVESILGELQTNPDEATEDLTPDETTVVAEPLEDNSETEVTSEVTGSELTPEQ